MTAVRCWIAAVLGLAIAGCSRAPSLERPEHPLPQDVEISAAEPGTRGGRFIRTLSQQPRTFNPLAINDTYSRQAADLVLSPLTTFDPVAEETVPALARTWQRSEDGLSYILHLRRGVRWSDGEPFTADDVMFTFDAVFDPRYPNRYAQQYTIGGEPLRYERLDEHTVRFSMARIHAPFLNDIGFVSILPRHRLQAAFENGTLLNAWTTQTAIRDPAAIVGTGPFRLLSFRPGERMTLVPNPHYWRADRRGQRLPYVDAVIVRFVASPNTETVLFATGQTDAADIAVGDVPWVREGAELYDFTLHDRGPASGISFIWFNQHRGSDAGGRPYMAPHKLAWFTERRFRQAMLMALDRPGLVEAVFFGRGQPLDSIISPANRKWHNPHVRHYSYDPAGARALLGEAGFRWRADGTLEDAAGRAVEFELLASEGSQRISSIVTTFQENLRDIGVRVRLTYLDFGTMVDKSSNTFDYDAAIMGFTGGGDPSGGKAIYRSDGRLHVWYPQQPEPATEWEARIDALVDAQEQELDEERRVALVWEMQEIFAEELPLLFLVTPNAYAGIRNRWRNVQVPALGSVIWNIDELWTVEDPG